MRIQYRGTHGNENPVTKRNIEEVLKSKTAEWMRLPGVEGLAIGEHHGTRCIRIFTSANPTHFRDQIPSIVEGYPVMIEQTGRFGALEPIE
jgi:hypothetical protein